MPPLAHQFRPDFESAAAWCCTPVACHHPGSVRELRPVNLSTSLPRSVRVGIHRVLIEFSRSRNHQNVAPNQARYLQAVPALVRPSDPRGNCSWWIVVYSAVTLWLTAPVNREAEVRLASSQIANALFEHLMANSGVSGRLAGKPHLTACWFRPESPTRNSSTLGDYRPRFSWEDTLATTFSPRFTIVSPQFHQPVSLSSCSNCQRFLADKPNKAKKEPGTHHNSPQTPKTRFTHSEVVGPQLLTLLRPRRPYFPKRARTRFPPAYSLSAGFPATIERDARGRVAQLDRASAF